MDPFSVPTGLEGPATFLQWGWLSISLPNLIVIAVMVVLFVLAVILPFPKNKGES